MNLHELNKPLVEISKEASKAILEIYNDPDRFDIQRKADDSPLTAADNAANDIICKKLEQLWSFPIISEENKQLDFVKRQDYEYCWLVDPLDGTKEFIRRNGEFTVNIALIKNGEPVVGVIQVPVTGEIFFASLGGGAFQLDSGRTIKLSSKTYEKKGSGLDFLCSRSHLSDATKVYIEQYAAPNFLPMGSSLKFIAIAKGQADIYPRLGPTMEWDTAAAQIILEEAGGQILDWNTKQKLKYNKPNLLNPDFIAFGRGEVL